MNLKQPRFIFTAIALMTGSLLVLGIVISPSEEAKINWLANTFDVSHEEDIYFIKYNAGKPEVYKSDPDHVELLATLQETKEVTDIALTADETALLIVTTNRESDELHSVVSKLDLTTFKRETIFEEQSLITEIAIDTKNEEHLYYLKAETFENYSPVAQASSHDFDIYKFDFKTKEHEQLTELSKYSMKSLRVSDEEATLYVQMDDDLHAESAGELFETKQRIFKVVLENEVELTVFSDPKRALDIYDFVVLEAEDALIYQSVSNPDTDGIFTYELFYYDLEKERERRLTHLSSYISNPVISKDQERIYFIVDESFGKQHTPNRKIYYLDRRDESLVEIKGIEE